ncbi:MAG: alginate export family protein [Nitrospinota bacterium]|jgi:hypothetical protein
MKRWNIFFVIVSFFVFFSADTYGADFTFGGQFRLRPEYRDNADFNKDTADTQKFYGQRIRLNVEAKIDDNIKSFIQIQDTRYWGAEGDTAGTVSSPDTLYTASEKEALDLHQAYVEIGMIGEIPLSIKVGRQLLVYGEHRLIGDLDWSNNARAFDAIKLIYKTETVSVDLWTSKLEENTINSAAPSPTSTGKDNDVDFYGLYSMIKTIPDVPIDLYLLYRNNEVIKEKRYTIGGRIEGKVINVIDLMGEGAYQFGDASTGVNIEAYALALRGGYTFPFTWDPRVSIEYDYATGDNDGTDKTNKTFDQLYPTWHRHLGYADLVGWQNISAVRLGINAKPTQKLYTYIDYWFFYLAQKKDGFYNAAGKATGFRAASAANTQDTVGNELDLLFKYTFNPNLILEGGLSRFFRGDYIKDRVGANSEDSDWGYLMLTLNF